MRSIGMPKLYLDASPSEVDTVSVRSTDPAGIYFDAHRVISTVTMKNTGLTEMHFDAYRV